MNDTRSRDEDQYLFLFIIPASEILYTTDNAQTFRVNVGPHSEVVVVRRSTGTRCCTRQVFDMLDVSN